MHKEIKKYVEGVQDFADQIISRAKKPIDRDELVYRLALYALRRERNSGLKMIRNGKIRIFEIKEQSGKFAIGVGIMNTPGAATRHAVTVCFCTPEDMKTTGWSQSYAAALLGYRMASEQYFEIREPYLEEETIADKVVVSGVFSTIMDLAYRNSARVPRFLRKLAIRGRIVDSNFDFSQIRFVKS